MASAMTSSLVSQKVATPARIARTQQRRSTVCSAAPKQDTRRNALQVAVAGFAAAAILTVQVPMAQADGVKSVVCASNPTSKICLKDSAKKGQTPSKAPLGQ